jgi:hypothetical protein
MGRLEETAMPDDDRNPLSSEQLAELNALPQRSATGPGVPVRELEPIVRDLSVEPPELRKGHIWIAWTDASGRVIGAVEGIGGVEQLREDTDGVVPSHRLRDPADPGGRWFGRIGITNPRWHAGQGLPDQPVPGETSYVSGGVISRAQAAAISADQARKRGILPRPDRITDHPYAELVGIAGCAYLAYSDGPRCGQPAERHEHGTFTLDQ